MAQKALKELGPGEAFGERALMLANEPRFATCTAAGDGRGGKGPGGHGTGRTRLLR